MKRLLILIALIVFYQQIGICQEPIRIRLNLFGNDTIVFNKLVFGFDKDATNGLDTGLGEVDLPPFVPPSGYGIYGVLVFYDSDSGGNVWSYTDLRPFPATSSDTIKFLLNVFRESGIKLKISWFGLNDYFRYAWLVDEYLGTLVQINMLETNFATITNEFLDKFYIKVVLNRFNDIRNESEIDAKYLVKEFPDKLLIKSFKSTVSNYEFFDIFGNQVLGGSFVESVEVSYENFAKGVYLLKVSDFNGEVHFKKVLIY